MWRVSRTRAFSFHQLLLPRSADRVLCASLNTRSTLNNNAELSQAGPSGRAPPTPSSESARSNSEGAAGGSENPGPSNGQLAGAALGGTLLVGAATLHFSEDTRFWVIERFPSSKSLFALVGYGVDRPLTSDLSTQSSVCNKADIERIIGKPKIQLPKETPVTSTSVIDVADKTVSALSINQALTNDRDRKLVNTLKAIDKVCGPCGGEEVPKVALKECTPTMREVKKPPTRENSLLLKAGSESAKLPLANCQQLTEAEIEERESREAEKYKKKVEEKLRKNEEYQQVQQEMREHKAATDLQKQKKDKAEQEELAGAAQYKILKNKEFEVEADKRISQVLELAEAAINANAIAIVTSREHNSKLKEAMDVNLEVDALKVWPEVHKLNEVRLEQVAEAHRVQLIAEVAVVEYIKLIDSAKRDCDTKDNSNIPTFRKQIQEVAFDVKTIHDKLKSQETVSSIMAHYYHLMKKDKAEFLNELQAIVPEIKIGEKGLNLSEEELNALLAHAHRRIFQLKKQLTEQQMLEYQRLEDALCEQKKLDVKEANIKIGEELDRQFDDLQLEKEAEILAHNRKFETEMRTKLAKQASDHHDHLQDMLSLQQKKLMEQFDLALRERLIHERHVFMDHIAKNMAKVKGIQAALEERANMEKEITLVQDLMSSALCLMHAVAHDVDCQGEQYDRVRIDEPLKRCFLASELYPFAQAVLHSIPNKAAEDGIYTMSSLEKRFEDFYNKSIIEASASDGGNFVTRQFNTLKYYMTAAPKPKYVDACGFENPEGMSTADLMVQAKYFMDKKCLPEAVRCLVQLGGKTRELAQDWLDEARLVLEVRQAAEVLMAHANSKGMGTVF